MIRRVERVTIQYFSDVLCVWAYVSQRRIDELQATFGDRVCVDAHFVSVFGDAHGKLERGWSERGGAAGYSAHVREVCARMGRPDVHDECWMKHTPRSSMAAHLYLAAVRVAEVDGALEPGSFDRATRRLRTAFFEEARNVADHAEQRRIVESLGLSPDVIEERIESGAAHASLSRDFDLVKNNGIAMSPTLLFNEGRQRLNGNVGYRVIEANVRELLENAQIPASWC